MPSSRITDPQTSVDAQRSIRGLTAQKIAIAGLLYQRGLTDEELVYHYKQKAISGEFPMASPSGIRSRRAELVADGWVENSGQRRTMTTGRTGIVWRLTTMGGELYGIAHS